MRVANFVNTSTSAGLALPSAASMRRLSLGVFALVVIWVAAVVVWANNYLAQFHAESPSLPFGVLVDSHHNYYIQDFSYHMIFLKGLRDHIVAEPYRLEQQETLMRHMIPGLPAGMSHGYSPVLMALMLPLLGLPGQKIYMVYTIMAGVATLLLFYFYILPRVTSRLQLCAVSAGVLGICLVAAFITGQSTLMTTPLLALFWAVAQKPRAGRTLAHDVVLALTFWALCLKPNVAMVPLFLLLGGREWRALAFGFAMLLATWIATSGYYGGWWTGLHDYLTLLSYYHPADFPPFLRRDADSELVRFFFPYDNAIFLGANIAMVLGRWTSRVSPSEQFQGTVWAFLLLSPYLLASEHWVIVLLIVEGAFFVQSNGLTAVLKMLLIVGILDLRLNVNSPVEVSIPCKWILFFWVLAFTVARRMKREPDAPAGEAVGAN